MKGLIGIAAAAAFCIHLPGAFAAEVEVTWLDPTCGYFVVELPPSDEPEKFGLFSARGLRLRLAGWGQFTDRLCRSGDSNCRRGCRRGRGLDLRAGLLALHTTDGANERQQHGQENESATTVAHVSLPFDLASGRSASAAPGRAPGAALGSRRG